MAERRFRLAAVVPLVVMVMVLGLVAGALWERREAQQQGRNPDELPSTVEGRPAPALTLTALADLEPLSDATLRTPGTKLVNFWASWCVPCRAEHPHLEALAAEGVPIYGINYKDAPADAMRFLAELGDPYRAIGADEGRTAIDWGVYGVPETFVLDGDGQVVLHHRGPLTPEVIEAEIRPLLSEASASGS